MRLGTRRRAGCDRRVSGRVRSMPVPCWSHLWLTAYWFVYALRNKEEEDTEAGATAVATKGSLEYGASRGFTQFPPSPRWLPLCEAASLSFACKVQSQTCKDSFPLSPLLTFPSRTRASANKTLVEASPSTVADTSYTSQRAFDQRLFRFYLCSFDPRRSVEPGVYPPTHLPALTAPWPPHRPSRLPQQKQPPRLSPRPWPPRRSPLPSHRHPSHPRRRRSPRTGVGTANGRTSKMGRSGRAKGKARRRTMEGSRRCLTMRRGLTSR